MKLLNGGADQSYIAITMSRQNLKKPQPHFPEAAPKIMTNKKNGTDSSTIFHFYSKHLASK